MQSNNKQSVEDEVKKLELIFSCIDLTTLQDTDTNTSTAQLAKNAVQLAEVPSLPSVAAVCVFPRFAKVVSTTLQDTAIKTACVAGMFPHGQSSLAVRLADVEDAVKHGADEIDMVISRGELIAGNYEYVANEVKAHKQACQNAHLKVILETAQLTMDETYKAAVIAIENGADFIKTSTGKAASGADIEKSIPMLQAIKEHREKTGNKIGFKPAGGIRTVEQAQDFLNLLQLHLGNQWLTPHLFRIGASSLAKEVLKQWGELTKNQVEQLL